jgi:hypothetical protein
MKTLIPAAIRCSLMFTAVAALSLAYPASVQAVPTTYQYTGNPFTIATGPYTTSDFVSGMVTLAGPLPPNFLGFVTPTAFTFSDGVQTITNLTSILVFFAFGTGPTGRIYYWEAEVVTADNSSISTWDTFDVVFDSAHYLTPNQEPGFGFNEQQPGVWEMRSAVADTGSTLSIMTLTLMALGLVARQFKRAAA